MTPSEHVEQCALFEWAAVAVKRYPQLANMFAIPNGGHRHIAVARKLKAEGVVAGIPDVFLAYPAGGYCGLWVELKRRKGGKVSPEQKKWLSRLNNAGYKAVVCRGWGEAREAIEAYITADTPR